MISIIIPTLPSDSYTKKLVEDIPNKVKSEYEIIVLDGNEGVNEKWNIGAKEAKGEYVWILNNDIVLTEGLDLELMEGLESHKIACPLTTEGKDKFKLPLIKANSNNIAGWCFILKKKDWIDIPESLNLWYGDNFSYEINNGDVYWGGLVHHYRSSTIKTMDVSQIIAQDKINWEKVKLQYNFG